jgi:selenium-binding protein 1
MRPNQFTRAAAFAAILLGLGTPFASADETCNSPYMSNLVKGQEDYLYVWTLGVPGMGDGSDKLVTLDVNPKSPKFGQVLTQLSVGGRGEAHHAGFTDDRRFLWAGGLDDSKIYVFDIHTDPAKPRLVNTIGDFAKRTGLAGPHTFYALPGRMLIGALSNARDGGGKTGMALYNNKGEFIRTYDMPAAPAVKGGDGYGYDLAINPGKNAMLSSSFTGKKNYMSALGTLIKDQGAMKQFGNTMVVWNLKSMQPEQVLSVPGAPLEIRWSLKEGADWAITATALTSKLWLVKKDAKGQWQAKDVAAIGDPARTPLPVDISMRADGKGLWVNTFMDGTTHYFDISNPEAPRQTYAKKTGSQVNMISQSWDGKRVYVSSSLLANWDKTGADNEQFVKLFAWDGKQLNEKWAVDFYKLKLGRPHHMKFGAKPGQLAADAGDAAPAASRLAAR